MKKVIVFLLVLGGGGYYVAQRQEIDETDKLITTAIAAEKTPVHIIYVQTPRPGRVDMAGEILWMGSGPITLTAAERGEVENSDGSRYGSATLFMTEAEEAGLQGRRLFDYKVDLVTGPTNLEYQK